MIYLYNFTITILTILFSPIIFLFILFNKKYKTGLNERLSIISDLPEKNKAEKRLWFHAASAGEVQALLPIINEVKKRKLEYSIMVTTTSITGKLKVEKELKNKLIYSSLLPIDLIFIVEKFIKKTKPDILIIVETEIWPSLIYTVKKNNIKLALINGRISKKSFPLYYIFSFFFKKFFNMFNLMIVQNEKIVKRLQKIGVKEPEIHILENTKFSYEINGILKKPINKIKNKIIITAGSIREGEEKLIIDSFFKTKKNYENILLIIAPRYLNRVKKIENLLKKYGLKYMLLSELNKIEENIDVIIVNTIGELIKLYSISDIAIVGGGFKKFGGHNPVEPAYFGLPIIMGENMFNFEDTASFFVKEGGAIFVPFDSEKIKDILVDLSKNENKRKKMGEKNKNIVFKFKNTASKTADILFTILN